MKMHQVNSIESMLSGVDYTQTIGLLYKSFESYFESEIELEERKKCLRKRASKESRDLYLILKGCSDETPCMSAACPVCFRSFRAWVITQTLGLIERSEGGEFGAAVLIFYDNAMTSKELRKSDPLQIKDKLLRKMQRLSCFRGPVIGGFEIDYHSDIQMWMPHFHLLMPRQEDGEKALKMYMDKQANLDRPGVQCNRPLLVQCLNDDAEQVSYLFKSYWKHIEVYRCPVTDKRKTAKQRLSPRRHALSLKVMDRLGFQGRLFMYGVRREGECLNVLSSSSDPFVAP